MNKTIPLAERWDLGRLATDPVYFVRELWKVCHYDAFAPIGWPEEEMIEWAAGVDIDAPRKRGVLSSRGIGKTFILVAALAAWDLYRDPDAKIPLISKAGKQPKKTLHLIRSWLHSVPFLKHLRPRTNTRARTWRDTTEELDVGPSKAARTPSIASIGIDGQIEGMRGHKLRADDVETEGNTKTFDARQGLAQRANEFDSIASYGNREVIIVGTIHHEETLYAELAKRGYVFRTWPLLFPSDEERYNERGEERFLNLAPGVIRRLASGEAKPGECLFSHRLDAEYVAEKQATGRRNFAMQHMLLADLGDAELYPLQLRDLIVFPVNRDKAPVSIAWGTTNDRGGSTRIEDIPSYGFGTDGFFSPIMFDEEWAAYTGTKMWIDPSGRGADKTGYSVVSHLNGFLWVKSVGALVGGFAPEVLERLALTARDQRVHEILAEDTGNMGMFVSLMEPVLQKYFLEPGQDPDFPNGWHCQIEGRNSTTQKEMRIIGALEPATSGHRVIVDPSVARNEDFQKQYTRITHQRNSLPHEDELESVANCIQEWRESLQQDPEKAAERSREKLLEEKLREHYEDCGMDFPEPRWFTLK